MHSFSIDFITGNTAPFYNKDFTLDAGTENQDRLQEPSANDSYFNTTQNFEDIYSVISKDAPLSETQSSGHEYILHNPDPNCVDQVPTARYQRPMYLLHNQNVVSKDTDLLTRSPDSKNETHIISSVSTNSCYEPGSIDQDDNDIVARSFYSNFLIPNPDITIKADVPIASPPVSNNEVHIISDGSPDPEYRIQTPDSLERGTPSPTQDSGIESTGCSPQASDQSSEDVSQTLEDLEKTASKVTNSNRSNDKPGLSYIALIAQAILSTRDNKMTLGDIYKHIRDNHGYYDNEEKAWRNSIRYNLSINECFIKAGKEESGKGNYWAIHPICLSDFAKGDYRRRQARRRARRGTRTLDLDTAPSRNVNYAAMTSSFLGYHPYGSTSMVPVHPYSIATPAQMFQSQSSAFTPTPTANFIQGKPMYTGSQAYSGFSNFMTPYMGSQPLMQKPVHLQSYQNSNTNTVLIQ